jgi:PPE-repeat protein
VLWHAVPPEVNTLRLMMGAGPAPMLQAAAGWQALATALTAQATELDVALKSLQQLWTGASSERAITAATPMVTWLQTAAGQAEQRATQATAQAAAYTAALGITPTLPDIATNHVTRAVLTATNFFGINTMPIGLKETDYFVRMWNQAAGAMDVYAAETAANTSFAPLTPAKPILAPAVGDVADAAGRLAKTTADTAKNGADAAATTLADTLRATLTDLASQIGNADLPSLEQLNQFATQISGPMQQMSQFGQQSFQQLQQMIQKAGGTGGLGGDPTADPQEDPADQIGLLGASPGSTHPLAGGSGPSVGAGMLRADSLPGAGGSPPRTPLLADLLGRSDPTATAPSAGAAGGSAAGSSAMGSGAAPMGAMGAGGQSSSTRSAPAVAQPLGREDDYEDEGQDPSDDDDW